MIKKMMLLAVSVAALAAFAVPATAGATVFTHEGEAIESGHIPVEYTGTAQFVTAGGGVHCEQIHAKVTFEANGMGTLKEFKGTNCKTNTGLPTHATARNLPWTVDALPGGKAEITGVDIHNSIRHPLNTNLEVATNVLSGNALVTLGEGGAATLSNGAGGMFINGTVPVTITGSLANGGTVIGTE